MQMEAGLDTGPVLLRRAVAIGAEETTGALHDRLSALGAEAIVDALAGLETLTPEVQPEDGVTYAAKIDKAEARIDWGQPAVEVDRLIRGLSPFPGAWTMLDGRRIKLLRSRVATGDGGPGEVLEGLRVACGNGAVEILELQAEGRARQDAAAFLRGTSVSPGVVLGEIR